MLTTDPSLDRLRAEIERRASDADLAALAREVPGDAGALLGAGSLAARAAALVDVARSERAVEALADAVVRRFPGAAVSLARLRREGLVEPETVLPGARLGELRVIQRLGRGPLGPVFVALDGDRRLRLRLLDARHLEQPGRLARLLGTARAAAAAVGGAAAPLPALRVVAGRTALVEPLPGGRLLAEIPVSGPRRLEVAAPLLLELIRVLADLHAAGVVHGGLSVTNALVVPASGAGPRVALLDAGAHFFHGAGELTAPEQILGEPPDARSDLFAFGELAYLWLTGRPAHPGAGAERARARIRGDHEPASFGGAALPDGVDELLLDLLDPDPGRRPESAATVRERLLSVSRAGGLAGIGEAELDADLSRVLSEPRDQAAQGVLEAAVDRGADPRMAADAFLLSAEGLPPGDPGRASLLRRAARALERVPGAEGEVERVLRRLVAEAPGETLAWELLEASLRRRGDASAVAECLIQHAEVTRSPEQRGQVLIALAEQLGERLGDREQARIAATEAFLAWPSERAAELVEAFAGPDARAWGEVLAATAGAVPDHLPAERRLARLLREARWGLGVAAAPERARERLAALLAEEPHHDAALDLRAELERRDRAYPELARTLLFRAEGMVDAGRARALCLEAAAILAGSAAEPGAAIDVLERLLERDPRDVEALERLHGLQRASGDTVALARVLERRLAAAGPADEVPLLEELAALRRGPLADARGASQVEARLLARSPAHPVALAAADAALRERGDHRALVDLHERAARAEPPGPARARELLLVAELAGTVLGDAGRARRAAEEALTLTPDDPRALELAATSRAGAGDAQGAAAARLSLADARTEPHRRASELTEAARLLEADGRVGEAMAALARALELDPGHAAAGVARRRLRLARGEVDAVVQELEGAVAEARGGAATPALATELAGILLSAAGEPGRASAAAERALAVDPGYLPALIVGAEAALASGRARPGVELVDRALARGAELDPVTATRLAVAGIDALADAGQGEQAAERAEALLRSHAGDRPTELRMARVLARVGTPDRGIGLSRDLLARGGPDAPDRGELLGILGEALLRAGRAADAIEPLELAVLAAPAAAAPLGALARALAAERRWPEARALLERLAGLTAGEERFLTLLELGAVLADRLGDLDGGRACTLEALSLRPGDRRALVQLVAFTTRARDWSALVSSLEALARVAPDPESAARHLAVAGRVAAAELGDPALARPLLEEALARSPDSAAVAREALAAYRALDDAEGMRGVLEREIAAAARANDRARARELAFALGDLHLSELHREDAIAVYESALRLGGSDPELEELLVDLYATDVARYLERATGVLASAIARDPLRAAPYRSLLSLYTSARRRDAALCACQALVALGAAGDDEQLWAHRHRSSGRLPPGTRLTEDELERLLRHPEADPVIDTVFARIEPAVVAARAQDPALALGPGVRPLAPAERGLPMVRALEQAAALLRLRLPALHVDEGRAAPLTLLPTAERALVLGTPSLRDGVDPREAAFVAASHLAYLRPGARVRALLPTVAAEKAWLVAAIRLVAPRLRVAPELEAAVGEAAAALARGLGPAERDWLAEPVGELLRRGSVADVGAWLHGTDLTADRAGLLASGDLPTAVAALRALPEGPAAAAAESRLRALLAFSVSGAYLELRERLKLSLEADGRPPAG